MAGVRAYFALFVWIAVAAGLFAALCSVERARRGAFVTFAALVLIVLWSAFAVGADAYYTYYQDLIARTTGINLSLSAWMPAGRGRPTAPADPSALPERLATLRDGFLGSGGATNFGMHRNRGPRPSVGEVAADLATGVGVMFVPITALKAVGVVSFDGGRGLLTLTDADTLFIDLTLLAIVATMFQAGAFSRRDVASIVFVAVLSVIATLVVGYVVTNFGTLFRLRLLATLPAGLAAVAIDPTRDR
jgi:hypothetical protein